LADRWFSSCLGPTFPNRRFLIAGTAHGLIDDLPFGLLDYPAGGTIFDVLTAHGISWVDYHNVSNLRLVLTRLLGKPGLRAFRGLGLLLANFVPRLARAVIGNNLLKLLPPFASELLLKVSLQEEGRSPRFLIHDRDTKFTGPFDVVFRSEGMRIVRTPIRAPNANGVCERWVGTLRAGCLDWTLILGRRHLEWVLRSYITHHHEARPHRGLDLGTPTGSPSPVVGDLRAETFADGTRWAVSSTNTEPHPEFVYPTSSRSVNRSVHAKTLSAEPASRLTRTSTICYLFKYHTTGSGIWGERARRQRRTGEWEAVGTIGSLGIRGRCERAGGLGPTDHLPDVGNPSQCHEAGDLHW
jgi:hypothetical protein